MTHRPLCHWAAATASDSVSHGSAGSTSTYTGRLPVSQPVMPGHTDKHIHSPSSPVVVLVERREHRLAAVVGSAEGTRGESFIVGGP